MYAIIKAMIIAIVLAALLIIIAKPLRKWRFILYIAVLLITAYMVGAPYYGLNGDWSPWFKNEVVVLFKLGILSTAIFLVVMWIGVLPKRLKITKKLLSVRAELSVIACILALGHNAIYASLFVRFFETIGDPSIMRGYWWYACLFSLILIALMIPLLITSFYSVRKWMSAKTWKKLQNLSYIFYVLLYLHVVGIYLYDMLHGYRGDTVFNIYTVLFGAYFVLRPIKYLWDRYNGNTTGQENEEAEEV
jgi:DMSO/TMAO reductase YedYZ heme-binding membrane subunit